MPHQPQPPTPPELRDALRHLRARPPAHLADVTNGQLPGAVERAVQRVERLRPNVARAVPRFVLTAAAQEPPPGGCRWCRPLASARVHRQRLQLTGTARFLLGPRCLACRQVLDPPKPKPRPRASARSSTSRGWRRVLLAAGRPAAALDPARGITPAQAAGNRAALRSFGVDPAKVPDLTRPTVGAR